MTYNTNGSLRTPGEFIQERLYLTNVSPKAVIFYGCAFKAFEGALELEQAKQRIMELPQRGVKSVSVNTYLTCINAYWKWNGKDWKVPPLKEEQKILATLSADHISSLIRYKAVGTNLSRAHMVALGILDTGLRCSEILGLTEKDIDMDGLVFKVVGKGGKHRVVPFSCELRRTLYKFHRRQSTGGFIFGTKNNRL